MCTDTQGFTEYFGSTWNWLDWSNLVLFVVIFISWFIFYLSNNEISSRRFKVEPRYYVYADIEAPVTVLKYNRTDEGRAHTVRLTALYRSRFA
jgi:hypothetical protein